MKRSRVFLLFDLFLFAALVIPLGIAVALRSQRPKAAIAYALALVFLIAITWAAKHMSHVSVRDYLHAIDS